MSTHIVYASLDRGCIQVSCYRTTQCELYRTRVRRGYTDKAYSAFARPAGFAGYEGDVFAFRHFYVRVRSKHPCRDESACVCMCIIFQKYKSSSDPIQLKLRYASSISSSFYAGYAGSKTVSDFE